MAWFKEILAEADKLGLSIGDGGASGTFQGHAVEIARVWADNQALYVARAPLVPAMDLGLEIRRRSFAAIIRLQIGEDDLEAEYAIFGDDAARVGRLLSGPLSKMIVDYDRAGFRLGLDDGGASVLADAASSNEPHELERVLSIAVRVAAEMDTARRRLGPAASLVDSAAALAEIARARGLDALATPAWIEGAIAGQRIALGARRAAANSYFLIANASFQPKLGLDLHLRRRGLLDKVGALVGRREIHTGAAEFDRHFSVRALSGQEARASLLLDTHVRTLLVELDATFGPLAIDDTSLTVGPVPIGLDSAAVGALIDLAADAAARIGRLATRPIPAGPYR